MGADRDAGRRGGPGAADRGARAARLSAASTGSPSGGATRTCRGEATDAVRQGSRDAFGTPAELEPILASLEPKPALHVIDRGDHSFKRGGRDPKVQAATFDEIQRTMVSWMSAIAG